MSLSMIELAGAARLAALLTDHHPTGSRTAGSASTDGLPCSLLGLVQDELDWHRSRLLKRRFGLSGPPQRKDLKDFDWSYNTRLPMREVLELVTLKFIEAREDALFIGSPGVGKSHNAKALA